MARGPAPRAGSRATLSLIAVLSLPAGGAFGAPGAEGVDRQTQAALAMDAHPDRGGPLFAQYCSKCHGPRALGDGKRLIPALAGQRHAYLVRQLANFAGSQRDSSSMHAVVSASALRSPQAWTDIGAYLNGLPNASPLTRGPGRDLERGSEVFTAHCAACHGSDAGGDEDGFVPSLRHQHYAYLNAQMRKLAQGYRHNLDADLMRFLGGFEERDMNAISDYLSRLTGPRTDRKKMRDDGVVVD
jgi:cytochrome c553